MCGFCPQSVLAKKYTGKQVLDYYSFCEILRKIPNNVRIDFSGFSEPFANEDCSKMILEANGREVFLYTTLSHFRSTDADLLRGFNFRHITIHCPDKKFFIMDENVWGRNLDNFLSCGFNPVYMAGGEVSEFVANKVGDNINVPPILSRAGNYKGKKILAHGASRCAIAGTTFSHNVLLPNGDVYLCCMDYSLEHKLGNLFECEYNGLIRQEKYDLCSFCEWGML